MSPFMGVCVREVAELHKQTAQLQQPMLLKELRERSSRCTHSSREEGRARLRMPRFFSSLKAGSLSILWSLGSGAGSLGSCAPRMSGKLCGTSRWFLGA